MGIKFTNWDEWKDMLAKMQAGLVACPDCSEWVSEIHKIPDNYKGGFSRLATWFFDPNSRNEYCCNNCMSHREKNYREIEYQRSTLVCDKCKKRITKTLVKEIVRNCGFGSTYATRYCPSCFVEVSLRKSNKKEQLRVDNQNNRAGKLGLISDLTLTEWLEIIKEHKDRCHYCGGTWSDMEHVVPISHGGGTTKANVVPSCRSCNLKKARQDSVGYGLLAKTKQGLLIE